MSNHAFLHSHSNKFSSAFKAGIDEAALRFKGAVRVEHQYNGITVVELMDPDSGNKVTEIAFGATQRQIEWRPGLDLLGRWFSLWVACFAAEVAADAIKAKVWMTDEGLGDERLAIDFHRQYPKLSDWARAMWDPMNLGVEPPALEQIMPGSSKLIALVDRRGDERLLPSGESKPI